MFFYKLEETVKVGKVKRQQMVLVNKRQEKGPYNS